MNKTAIGALVLATVTSLWTWMPEAEREAAPKVEREQVLTASGSVVAPEKVAGIRVVSMDTATNEAVPFEVKRVEGRWLIPSHFDYPADGGTQVGETAGAVLNIPMGPLVTSKKAEHSEYGVEDPVAQGSGDGAGKRVTLTDEGGAVLVDVIIGKQKSQTKVYFVRRANEPQVYTASVKPKNIKTNFEDWVEVSLLKVATNEIREATVKNYSVNEESGSVTKRSMVVFSKKKDEGAWTLLPTFPGKGVNIETVDTFIKEAAQLTLVGVRPFDSDWLQERGFYLGSTPTRGRQLYGNEGEVQIVSKYGLVYRLYFGEIALGDDGDKKVKRPDVNSITSNSANHNRYMAIFVQYDPEFDEDIPAPEFSEEDVAAPKEKDSEDPKPPKVPKNQAEIASALKAGQARAEKAQARFQEFFYVVSNASFEKLRPAREAFYKSAE